ncbi:MAG: rhomboid family intramembrane serine protease [Flavobacteriales bacterium]|nr:rhomboid family intramembrane serine protease [Flavobacteriales bacterium]
MAGLKDDIKRIYSTSNTASRYVLINVAVFLSIIIVKFIAWGFQANGFDIIEWIGLPSSFEVFMTRPWSVFSYMFVHEAFFHILINMLWLFMAGRIFVDLLGSKKFVKTYWLGGFFGGLLYLLLYNLFPALQGSNATLIGASGAVFAVFIGLASYVPDYVIRLVFIGPVKLKWVAIVFVILMLPTNSGNLGGHIAHLGGAMWGFIYARNLRGGNDLAQWFDSTADWVINLFERKERPRMRVYKGAGKANYSRDNYNYNEQKKKEQEEIDRILDKISKSGYESLSSSEKATLFKASNKG